MAFVLLKEVQGIYGECGTFRPGVTSVALVLSFRYMLPRGPGFCPKIFNCLFASKAVQTNTSAWTDRTFRRATRRSLGYNCVRRVWDSSCMASKGPGAGADGDDPNLTLGFG